MSTSVGPATQTRLSSIPGAAPGGHSIAWWGTVLLIANEAVLFACLVASYFYMRFNSPVWPVNDLPRPELLLPLINTILLVSSSFAMHWAQTGNRQGKQGRLRGGLALAFVLAAVFVGLQLFEYSRTEFSPRANVYAALFFTITGIHGLHVTVALLANAVLQGKVALSEFNRDRFESLECVSLYWHFVDVVWLFILTALYLSPYL